MLAAVASLLGPTIVELSLAERSPPESWSLGTHFLIVTGVLELILVLSVTLT